MTHCGQVRFAFPLTTSGVVSAFSHTDFSFAMARMKSAAGVSNDGSRQRGTLCNRIEAFRNRKKGKDAARKTSGFAAAPGLVQEPTKNGVRNHIVDPTASVHSVLIGTDALQPGKGKEVVFDTGNTSRSAPEDIQEIHEECERGRIVDRPAAEQPILMAADMPQLGKGKLIASDGTEKTSGSAPEEIQEVYEESIRKPIVDATEQPTPIAQLRTGKDELQN